MARRLRELLQAVAGGHALVLRGAGLALAIQVAGMLTVYVVELTLARSMGAADYGVYRYLIGWASLLAIPAGLGFPTAAVRFWPVWIERRDWGRLRGFRRFSDAATVLGAGLAALAAVAVFRWARLPGHDQPAFAALMVALVVAWALMQLQTEEARALGRIGIAFLPPRVVRPALVLAVGMAVARGFELAATDVVRSLLVAVTAAAVAQRLLLRAALPRPALRARPIAERGDWLRVALPLLLVAGFSVVLAQSDIVLIGFFLDAERVGTYNVAARLATLVTVFLTAVNATAAPRFSALYHAGDRRALQTLVSSTAHWIAWPSLPTAAVLAVFAPWILAFFGPEFATAVLPLHLLLLGQIVNAGVGPVGYLLQMTGHQGAVARVYGWSAALNVLLNLILIPWLGTAGAAAATAATLILWNVWLAALVRGRIGVNPSILAALRRRAD